MGLNLEVINSPYNQVFQELLSPYSSLNRNTGINVLFIRIEDWLREHADMNVEEQISLLKKLCSELKTAIKCARETSRVPYLVSIIPKSNCYHRDLRIVNLINQLNFELESFLSELYAFHLVDIAQIVNLYKVDQIFDCKADEVGHIPFTPEFYAGLSTFIARKVYAMSSSPFKAIVVDCDDTLWKGVCGEVGSLNVEINQNYDNLQKFLIEKYHQGFFLCLSSKNNEEDVWEVFDRHPRMRITREYFSAHQINWNSKSENIQIIGKELNIGLDSLIFIDDNLFEIEQMMVNVPEVLSVHLPVDTENYLDFLNHIWAFDRANISEEDHLRNKMYKEEKLRKDAKLNFNLLSEFYQSLNIEVSLNPLQYDDLSRAAQLTIRTNQFNLNGVRKTEDELFKIICQANVVHWGVRVKDRFGDYGFVGLIIARIDDEVLIIDSFLLSCRVLGRNVENELLRKIYQFCASKGIQKIFMSFADTTKNKPFNDFLSSNDLNMGYNYITVSA